MASPALPPKLQAMVDALAAEDDLEGKYDALIDMGRAVPDIPDDHKTEACMVHGCQSLVHVYAELGPDGRLALHGRADALIVNGLLALLVLGLDSLTPREFLAVDPKFIDRTGILGALTPSRVNGFHNVYLKLKADVERLLDHAD